MEGPGAFLGMTIPEAAKKLLASRRQPMRNPDIAAAIGEYVRGGAHTNTIEGYFSILKGGIIGVYHHVSQQHLKRYLAEFDFRYNNRSALGVEDFDRTMAALVGINESG